MSKILATSFTSLESALPDRAGKALVRNVWKSRGKPRIYVDPQQHAPDGLGKGSVTFSLDFELAWAWRYSKSSARDCVALGLRERAQVPGILAEFDRHHMGATWAAVGHLFLGSCSRGADGRAHPEIPPIAPFETRWWRFDGPDWFAQDPCTDLSRDPAWYGPDLIAQIKASPAGHEIACHSFSHLGLGANCPHETALAELRACRVLMEAAGVEIGSFIHPGNDFGNYAALKEAGFSNFRVFPWERGDISLPVLRPDGLWIVPSAACLENGKETNPRRLRVHRRRLELLIDAAAATGLNAHLWLHPSIPSAQVKYIFSPILDYCQNLRDEGKLDILTMRELVARTEARQAHPHGHGHPVEGIVT